MGRVFFTADTHFGHNGVIKLSERPFESVAVMDETLIERWNAMIGPGDRVYHLGDFCFKGSKLAASMLEKLQGEIVLIRGNHDTDNTAALPRFAAAHDLLQVTVEKKKLVLCHYPLLEWPGAFRGALHLHGHTHGAVPMNRRRADVGVDVWDFRPVTLEEIAARLEAAPDYDPLAAYDERARLKRG